jgi:hypothetical protein
MTTSITSHGGAILGQVDIPPLINSPGEAYVKSWLSQRFFAIMMAEQDGE